MRILLLLAVGMNHADGAEGVLIATTTRQVHGIDSLLRDTDLQRGELVVDGSRTEEEEVHLRAVREGARIKVDVV